MLPYALNKIDAAVIQEICELHFSESETVDFKQELTKANDGGKNELAKDVAAMANADGGDIVFGIKEEKGSGEKPGGTAESIVPIADEPFEVAQRRFVQTLDSWLEPKLRGIQYKHVAVLGGYVMVVRVPASFDGPHCTRNSNDQRRFAIRNGTVTTDMSYDQIRNAFDRTASLAEKARELTNQRMAMVAARQTPRPMDPVPICVAEFVPLSGLAGRAKVDVAKLHKDDFGFLALPKWRGGGVSRSLNLDGLIVHPGGRDTVNAMTHVFRDGRLEFLLIGGGEREEGRKLIWSKIVTDFIEQAAEASFQLAEKCGMSGPAILTFALMHVADHEFAIKDHFFQFSPAKADRGNLIFPEIWIEDVSVKVDVAELVAPTIEVLWQAFEFERAKQQD